MKTFREWQKINESLGYSLGLSNPATVGISSNFSSLQELLEAKKKAMKKKMGLDDETGDGEIVPPKSDKDVPEDEDLKDKDVPGDEDSDSDDVDHEEEHEDSEDVSLKDKKNLMFMKKKMKKEDDKKDKKEDKKEDEGKDDKKTCDCKKGEHCSKCKKNESKENGFFTIFENNKLVTCSSSKKEIESLLKTFSENRKEKIEMKDENGNILWHN